MSVAASPVTGSPSAADVSAFLLELHESSNEATHHEVQALALERFSELIPFESGLLGMGTIQDGVPHGHDIVVHGISMELMQSWESIKHQDRVAMWAFAHPGETGNFAVDGGIFEGLLEALDHCRRFRLAHVLCTSMISPAAGLYWVMSTYREDPARPFTEEERKATQMLVPHIFSASRRARIMQLRTHAKIEGAHDHPQAIANDVGLILEAEPGFAELLRGGFPGWSGPLLPEEVARELAPGKATRIKKPKLVVSADPAGGTFLVQARRLLAADTLTTREREIAEAFSLGETHRELATRFGVSPNTVRRHLANIYEKLGISSKAELDRMLR